MRQFIAQALFRLFGYALVVFLITLYYVVLARVVRDYYGL